MPDTTDSQYPQYDVAIVGAGFSGLYLLHRCRKLGLTARIWEKGSGLGGVWYWNRYPGARCDVESMQYSYQFDEALQQEWNWSERYSSQPEILKYLQSVARRFELTDGVEFERQVEKAYFNEARSAWELTASDGNTMSAQFCVMATGCLSVPNWPSIDGMENFSGDIYHTALWPHRGVDFKDKRVAVIGTGSSGIQSIPHIAADASSLSIFQRTPNYSVPAHNYPLSPDYIESIKSNYQQLRARAMEKHNAIDGVYSKTSALAVTAQERQHEYEKRWNAGGLTFLGAFGDLLTDSEANRTVVEFVHEKIQSVVSDPTVARLLMPNNIIGGKRLCVDSDYYSTYNRDNVSLIDLNSHPLVSINPNGLSTTEADYDADIIVFATGFDAMTGALNRIDIKGRSGRSLKDRWLQGPATYLGLAMADYPNLFTVTGPGSPSVLTNMIPSIEHHVEWITDCISQMRSHDYSLMEASVEAQDQWWQHVQDIGQSGLKHTTRSWYRGSNVDGKPDVFLPYNGGFPAYLRKCAEVKNNDYEGFVLT